MHTEYLLISYYVILIQKLGIIRTQYMYVIRLQRFSGAT